MQFDEMGNMSGKTLMLLPGTACDYQTNFGTVLDRLGEKYHLICVNYDGFDGSGSTFPDILTVTEEIEQYIKDNYGGRLNGDITDNFSYSSAAPALVAFYPPVEFYTMKAEYMFRGDREHGEGKFKSMYLGVNDIYLEEESCRKAYWETYTDFLPDDFMLRISAGELKTDIRIFRCQSTCSAGHVDLYDDISLIPFDKLESFFRESLK